MSFIVAGSALLLALLPDIVLDDIGVRRGQEGLVVTSVPKVPFWKACYFNQLCLKLPDNILICLEIQLFPFGDAIQEGCIDKCLAKRSQDRATPEPALVP